MHQLAKTFKFIPAASWKILHIGGLLASHLVSQLVSYLVSIHHQPTIQSIKGNQYQSTNQSTYFLNMVIGKPSWSLRMYQSTVCGLLLIQPIQCWPIFPAVCRWLLSSAIRQDLSRGWALLSHRPSNLISLAKYKIGKIYFIIQQTCFVGSFNRNW